MTSAGLKLQNAWVLWLKMRRICWYPGWFPEPSLDPLKSFI